MGWGGQGDVDGPCECAVGPNPCGAVICTPHCYHNTTAFLQEDVTMPKKEFDFIRSADEVNV